MFLRQCTKCLIEKDFYSFGRTSKGLNYWCKLCNKTYKKSYYVKNLDKSKAERLKWQVANKATRLPYIRAYLSKRYQDDPIFRIIKNQRNRLRELITIKPCSFSKSIGLSSAELKNYLESKFYPDSLTGEVMSWDNYSDWEIDHIRPLASFSDLESMDQFKEAFNYNNLQPLWKRDNRLKSDHWEQKYEDK